jgi:hypothetical protein
MHAHMYTESNWNSNKSDHDFSPTFKEDSDFLIRGHLNFEESASRHLSLTEERHLGFFGVSFFQINLSGCRLLRLVLRAETHSI